MKRLPILTLIFAAALIISAWYAYKKPRVETFRTYVIASSILLGANLISSSRGGR